MLITWSKVSEKYTNLLREMSCGIPFTLSRGSFVEVVGERGISQRLVICEENISQGTERLQKQLVVEGDYQLAQRC